FSHSMDNSTGPVLLFTLLLMQNTSSPKASSPPAGYEMAELPSPGTGPSRNHSLVEYGLRLGEIAAASVVWGVLWLISVMGNFLVCLYLTPGVQLYVLLAISVDRFYTIVYPLSFKVSRGKAKKMILASWLCGALFASPACFLYGSNSDQHCNFFLPSSWQGSAYSIIHLLLVFMIPSLFIILFYQKVIKYIWRIGTDGMTVRRTTNIVPRTKVKTIKMFLMLNSMFLLSWLPFFMVQLWHPQETDYRKSSLLFLAINWISFSSSASKPTLYSIYNANFRRGMKETFCMSAMKCYRSNAYTITTSSRIAKKNHV
ncbi:GPR19 protein, partial [Emberiza fucata]|nr:GPR19 protein [Emberiza fucata]